MGFSEQAQRFLGITLNNDNGRCLFAPRCQNECPHFFSDVVCLREIQNRVKHAQHMNWVTSPIGHNRLHQP